VGITNEVQDSELKGISGTGVKDETWFTAPTYNVENRIIENIIRQTCKKISGWTQWSSWSRCSAQCGTGEESRSRICGGGDCPGMRMESRFCSTQACQGFTRDGRQLCNNKHPNGHKYMKMLQSMPFECTCSVRGNRWYTTCVPRGCRYEGLVYKVGESWTSSMDGNTIQQCRCMVDGQSTRIQCDPMPVSMMSMPRMDQAGNVLCEGQYLDNEKWPKTNDQGMPLECTCNVFSSSWSVKCVPIGCPYMGRVYKAGETWDAMHSGEQHNCRCEAKGMGTQTFCDPVGTRPRPMRTSPPGPMPPRGPMGPGPIAPPGAGPMCDNRYRHNESFQRTVFGMPYECKCIVRGNQANSDCKPAACRYGGRIYKVGEMWRSGSQMCDCYKSGDSVRWSCN